MVKLGGVDGYVVVWLCSVWLIVWCNVWCIVWLVWLSYWGIVWWVVVIRGKSPNMVCE